jgi:5-oxoprolinase (ATP-hydrolysing) subunit A
MQRTVERARARGVDLGAHVGFPDRQGFGRRVMHIDPGELAAMVVYQLGALDGIARAAGYRVTHMSFHGALGNMAAADDKLARPLLRAVVAFAPRMLIVSSRSAAIEGAAAECGLPVATTFLADRAYDDRGLLVPRGQPGAVIHDGPTVLERVKRLLVDGIVVTASGKELVMPSQSILLHGDNSGAVGLAKMIRGAIEDAGGEVVPVSRLMTVGNAAAS